MTTLTDNINAVGRATRAMIEHPRPPGKSITQRHPAAGASTLPSEPYWVVMVIRSLDNPDELPERRRVNFNNPQSRKHALSYQTWCLYNRRSCTIAPDTE